MRKSGEPTKYPGVSRIASKTYQVRGKVIDPRTGKPKEVDRVLDNVTLLQAVRIRAELLDELRHKSSALQVKRLRVGEYAQLWMRTKVGKIDPQTASRYANALDQHILPVLGDLYYDVLTQRDVQEWVDQCLDGHWETPGKQKRRKPYKLASVHGWYRVLRNMTRDAIGELELERDPTLRIAFPDGEPATEPKSLAPDELTRFLTAVRQRYPQHFALTVTLVFTGLRFCHASALEWEDWDETIGILRVQRKQVHGVVGALTRRKPGPGVCPVGPELADVLRAHRRELLRQQTPGLADGWMFPARTGKLLRLSTLATAWRGALEAAGITRHFTIHGTRYTFTDLTRLANVDAVVRRSLVGHVTETMQQHYSHVAIEEKRAAVAGVYRLVPLAGVLAPQGGDAGGDADTAG